MAQIEGDVVGQKGIGVSDATLTATDVNGKVVATVKSDKRGFYQFKGLKIGKYKIEVKAAGFRPAVVENVAVNTEEADDEIERDDVSGATRLNIKLTPN